jgi:hypothetical protein
VSDEERKARPEQEIFDELGILCARPGFIHAISMFCFRDNIIHYKDKLTADELIKLYSNDRLIRTEISTLIGLMVRSTIDRSIPPPDELQDLLNKAEALLGELHEALTEPFKVGLRAAAEQQKNGTPNSDSLQHSDPFDTAEAMREPIFYGPESAFSFQYRDLASKKYGQDDAWLRSKKGFSIAEAVQVISSLGVVGDKRLNEWVNELRHVSPDNWTMLPGFARSCSDVTEHSGLPQETVRKVLDAFSFPNDGNPSFVSLSDYNATNAFPILKLADDEYIVLQYAALTEALYDSPFYWMITDKTYKETAMTNRGRFAEEFSAERLEKVFGRDRVLRNVDIWKSKDEKLGEIDTLVLFADRAIVLQAKSKKLTIDARKGNDLQLRGDFKAAIQDACDQAFLCSEQIVLNKLRFTDASGKEITLPKQTKKIHPICVVSDHYPALSYQARQFLKFTSSNVVVAPLVCDVFALDVITEFLEAPLRLLSYLELRAIAGDNIVTSHEITVLAFHLKRNLWWGDEYHMIHLHDDISSDVDIAMMARRVGVEGEKTPPGILTHLKSLSMGRMIEELEKLAEPWPVEVGLELLKLGGDTVRDLSLSIDKIAELAADDGRLHDVTFSLGSASSGVTVHCTNDDTLATATRLKRHCEARKYSRKAATWYGIAISPANAKVRLTVVLHGAWKYDEELEAAVRDMPKEQKPSAIHRLLKPGRRSKS